jgi:hypothetical protein
MGYCNAGVVQPAELGVLLTCGVCEHDVSYEDSRCAPTPGDTSGSGA